MTGRRPSGFAAALLAAAAAVLLAPEAASAQDYYWENPRFLSDPSARYPAALELPGGIAVVWQESRSTGPDSGEAFLSLALLLDGKPEVLNRRFAGPYPFRGNEPVLLSAASSPSGELAVAVLSGDREATVLVSRDGGLTFPVTATVISDLTISAPRIFPRSGGGWYLFAARGREDSLTIYYARTEDGRTWTEFRPFVNGGDNLPLSFLPSAASVPGADIVVFQALSGGTRPTYQIYSKRSTDGGAAWSPALQVTNFGNESGTAAADTFQNQRPHGSPACSPGRARCPAGSACVPGKRPMAGGGRPGRPTSGWLARGRN